MAHVNQEGFNSASGGQEASQRGFNNGIGSLGSAMEDKVSFLVDLREVSSFVLKCRDPFYIASQSSLPVINLTGQVSTRLPGPSRSCGAGVCRSGLTVRILQKGHYISRMGVVDC